jgi:hypothetical protein
LARVQLECEELAGDAFFFQDLFQVGGGFGLIAGGIAGVDVEELGESVEDFGS